MRAHASERARWQKFDIHIDFLNLTFFFVLVSVSLLLSNHLPPPLLPNIRHTHTATHTDSLRYTCAEISLCMRGGVGMDEVYSQPTCS